MEDEREVNNLYPFLSVLSHKKHTHTNSYIQVELSEAEALCQYIPEISFVMETSAKENLNITDIFYSLASELMVHSMHIIN